MCVAVSSNSRFATRTGRLATKRERLERTVPRGRQRQGSVARRRIGARTVRCHAMLARVRPSDRNSALRRSSLRARAYRRVCLATAPVSPDQRTGSSPGSRSGDLPLIAPRATRELRKIFTAQLSRFADLPHNVRHERRPKGAAFSTSARWRGRIRSGAKLRARTVTSRTSTKA